MMIIRGFCLLVFLILLGCSDAMPYNYTIVYKDKQSGETSTIINGHYSLRECVRELNGDISDLQKSGAVIVKNSGCIRQKNYDGYERQ